MMVSLMDEDKSCNTHLISCLRTNNILEGRTVIFPISPKLMGIFIFVLFFYFMNKCVKEDHKTPKTINKSVPHVNKAKFGLFK